jgi:transposase
MAKHRSHSIEFKRQIAQEFIAGETLHGLAKRHDLSRNLIRVWVRKYEQGAFDDDAQAADLLQEYEARIAALERLVGKQALELEFLKGALRNAPRPRSGLYPSSPARGSLRQRRMPTDGDLALDLLRLPGKGRRRYRDCGGYLCDL